MKEVGDLLAGLANSSLPAKPNPQPVFDNKAPLEDSQAHSAVRPAWASVLGPHV